MSDRSNGIVKWFNNARGYGFITCDGKNEDVFVHYRNIRGDGFRSLNEGQPVEFHLATGEKGLQAEDVLIEEVV
jgi:CspA family cold shock protein